MKEKNYNQIITPKSAFIVFEEEEAVHRALASKNNLLFYDEKLKFKTPPEPSDIIWENRHASSSKWCIRALIASFIIFLLLLITFLGIMFLKTWTTKAQYGEMNCETVQKFYPTDRILKKYAIKEWLTLNGKNSQITLDGALKCYCKKEKEQFGYSEIIYKEYSDPTLLDARGKPREGKICLDYLFDNYWSMIMTQAVAYLIIFINMFSRMILVVLIEWIGYPTQSSLNKAYNIAIFVTQFFNTAIILLLVKSNFSDSGIPLIGRIFTSVYYDFDYNWYDDIGSSLAFAMFYSAIWPIIEFIFFFGIRFFTRILDSWSL